MAEIIKVYRESHPAVRLIGKRYLGAKREPSHYTDRWEEWFIKDWFAPLQKLQLVENEGDAYIGSMRFRDGELEYWIGMMAAAGSPVPEGYEFEFLDIPAGEIGVAWLKGQDDWGLYRKHNDCVEAFLAQGMNIREDADFFERYTRTRFTEPDAEGNVILDYCVHL